MLLMTTILQTLAKGFTYSGAFQHIILNYSLIFLTLYSLILIRKSDSTNIKPWQTAFILSFSLQIFLWFYPGAEGVSVVWCTMTGFGLIHLLQGKIETTSAKYTLIGIALVPALLSNLYYAFTFPPITTLAHFLAILMGMLLGFQRKPALA